MSFWSKLASNIRSTATAIGGAIGGRAGAYVGRIIGEGIEAWVTGRSFDTQVLNPFQFRGATPIVEDGKDILDWHDKTFEAWIKSESAKLRTVGVNVNTDAYRSKVNALILRLETLRLYYNSKPVLQGRGMNVDLSGVKDKAEIITIYLNAIRGMYVEALKGTGGAPFRKPFDFNASNAVFSYPEKLNWNGVQATSKPELYVGKMSDTLSINYNGLATSVGGGGNLFLEAVNTPQPIKTVKEPLIMVNDPSIVRTPINPPTGTPTGTQTGTQTGTATVSQTTTAPIQANAGKWFGLALLAIGLGSYYSRKNKKKK